MAVIYLKHPTHGAKVATMDLEADADERNGWERYTLGEEVQPAFLNQLPRRGRPRKEPENVDERG